MKINLLYRPILADLGDGLILCRSTAPDATALADFNSHIHSDSGFEHPDERVGAWTYDLLARPHPTFHPDDCTLVVETATGKIVSSMNLISQTWAYAGIPFGVGRPELVGTLPEYRNRGLVRAQFSEIHRWSEERSELLQGITGIPFYYRLFGYEMGLELGGGRTGYEDQLPKLKDGETEPYTLQSAVEADIPFLMEVYGYACQRHLITCVWDEKNWNYALCGRSEKSEMRQEFRIISRAADGEPVGYLIHPWHDRDTGLGAARYELKPGISWLEVTSTVARYLWDTGGVYFKRDGKLEKRVSYSFWFGSHHPAYQVFQGKLPGHRDPYAWYIRIPDLPKFLRHIASVLEKRLSMSILVGYKGEVKVSFYRSGIRLAFDRGLLTNIETWRPSPADGGRCAFPDLTFLQLILGYRSIEELEQSYADCWYQDDETRVLLSALFPKQASSVMMVS